MLLSAKSKRIRQDHGHPSKKLKMLSKAIDVGNQVTTIYAGDSRLICGKIKYSNFKPDLN